ncbi:MAG: hypothetical protein LPH21_09670 [Shewanella sp.]|nr:hypothetical protein [Shewanella sp.]MCF1431126.1 hypothetical protein [Shewanella sp.]MCF1457808.1 hypothetical protein [Shewanella sp.]
MKAGRRNPGMDPLSRFIRIATLLCWAIFFSGLMLYHYGRPQINYGFLRYLQIEVREDWLTGTKPLLYIILMVCTMMSLVTFFLLRQRSRRANDNRSYNLLGLMLFSVGFILAISL